MSKGKNLFFKARTGLLILAALCVLVSVMCAMGKAQAVQKTAIERPSKEAIAGETRQILADPRFAPRKTFWQWLRGKLANWEGLHTKRGRGILTFLLWTLFIWGILTLLAILAHLIWTIYILARPGGRDRRTGEGAILLSPAMETMPVDQLIARAQELAAKGLFVEALGFLMVSILRRLEGAGLIGFHKSKTNGDYVREYPAENPTKAQFGKFVLAFEKTVYGGGICSQEFFNNMHKLSEEIVQGAD
jgi:hypothetical protein